MSVIYVVDRVKRCFKSVKVAISKYYVIIIIITLQLDLKNMLGYRFAEGLKISDNFFPPLMFNFAFLNKIVEIKFSKYNCPKSLLCRHRRGVFIPYMSPSDCLCYLFKYRKLYDLFCISSTARIKKKKD